MKSLVRIRESLLQTLSFREKVKIQIANAARDRLQLPNSPKTFIRYKTQSNRQVSNRPKVIAILDEFSELAWSFEFDLVLVNPQNWRKAVQEGADFLFVESCWKGNRGLWRGKIGGTSKTASLELCQLIEACQKNQIPTVFWNKEDPVHYEDFINAASRFDYIFTTDQRSIARYKEDTNCRDVKLLQFAAAPNIHNPIRVTPADRLGDVVFAGMYFSHKFPERAKQLDVLLRGAISASIGSAEGLAIFSRVSGSDKRYRFPVEYQSYVRGSLEYPRMLTAYHYFKVFLNANSVTHSKTMFSRRVFEALASGAAVVSGESSAIEQIFPSDEVPIVNSKEEAELAIRPLLTSEELRSRQIKRAQRRIWAEHTYERRANSILKTLGLKDSRDEGVPLISVILMSNRPDRITSAIEQICAQAYPNIEMIIGLHGIQSANVDKNIGNKMNSKVQLNFVEIPSSCSLGDGLNMLIDVSHGEYIAKMDDDDYYGPFYLQDSLDALNFSGADLVGKSASYVFLEGFETLCLRQEEDEHRWVDLVPGPTMFGKATSFNVLRFAPLMKGEDTDFQRRLKRLGGKIYSADRFGFLRFRGEAKNHTWAVADKEILSSSRVIVQNCQFDSIKHVVEA